MTPIVLSADQRKVFDAADSWIADSGNKPILSMAGFAGCGKTTLLGALAKDWNPRIRIAFVCFTGRAVVVLRKALDSWGVSYSTALYGKGAGECYCGTVHSLIYRPCVCRDPPPKPKPGQPQKLPLETVRCSCGGTGFLMRSTSQGLSFDLIVVDEASMVHEGMAQDLESFGKPILYVGDHGQLPPVGGVGSKVQNPDLRLEKIHRQAEGNPIIALAQTVRTTGKLPMTAEKVKGVRYQSRRTMADVAKDLAYRASTQMRTTLIAGGEQQSTVSFAVITRTNSMRLLWNKAIRKCRYAGDYDPMPLPGDYVIALRNKPPIFNGMRGIVQSIAGRRPLVTDLIVKFDDLPSVSKVTACNFQFNREYTFQNSNEIEAAALARGIDQESVDHTNYWGDLVDYGYALTCHKAQGSSFDTVVLYLDRLLDPTDDNNRRWLYTAVTRAKHDIIILT